MQKGVVHLLAASCLLITSGLLLRGNYGSRYLRTERRSVGARQVSVLFGDGGIGTFPGGQSTGGYSEFDSEHIPKDVYNEKTATERERLRRLKPKVCVFTAHPVFF